MRKKIDKMDEIKVQCPCGGETRKIKTHWKGIPVRGWKCVKCGEEILHPLDAERAMEIAKAMAKGELKVKVRRVGKSLTMTIPSKLAQFAELEEGTIANWGINSKKELVVEIVG